MPKGFPEEVPISQAEGELKPPPAPGRDTTFYLTAFARSDEDPGTLYAVIQPEASALPGKGDSFSSPTGLTRTAASPPSSGFPTCPCRPTERTAPMRPGLASQGPGEQFALYVDRALFLRSDAITIQLGSFYRLTYAPAGLGIGGFLCPLC